MSNCAKNSKLTNSKLSEYLMNDRIAWSEIEIANVHNTSRLISSKSVQPLKIFNPKSHSKTCHVMLSNYGGGMVSGDKINLAVNCHNKSNLFLSTQANGRVFKSIDQEVSTQTIQGNLGDNAMLVFFPDPVVLHAESCFKQKQLWELKRTSLLFLVDWYNAGRTDVGEKFLFKSLETELRIKIEDKLEVLDRFGFEPDINIPASPANFQDYQSFFSVYLLGNTNDQRFIALQDKLLSLKTKEDDALNFKMLSKGSIVSVSKVKDGIIILRALGKSKKYLHHLYKALMTALASSEILGFCPMKRKF